MFLINVIVVSVNHQDSALGKAFPQPRQSRHVIGSGTQEGVVFGCHVSRDHDKSAFQKFFTQLRLEHLSGLFPKLFLRPCLELPVTDANDGSSVI